jgi:hypothetical protein
MVDWRDITRLGGRLLVAGWWGVDTCFRVGDGRGDGDVASPGRDSWAQVCGAAGWVATSGTTSATSRDWDLIC